MHKDLQTNRERKNRLVVYLNDDEKKIYEAKYKASGLLSRSAFLRKLIVYGFVYKIEFDSVIKLNTELSRIGNNINQIAHKMNATNGVYDEDVKEIKKRLSEMEELWQSLKSTLSSLQ